VGEGLASQSLLCASREAEEGKKETAPSPSKVAGGYLELTLPTLFYHSSPFLSIPGGFASENKVVRTYKLALLVRRALLRVLGLRLSRRCNGKAAEGTPRSNVSLKRKRRASRRGKSSTKGGFGFHATPFSLSFPSLGFSGS
jgi:hypothetical protein